MIESLLMADVWVTGNTHEALPILRKASIKVAAGEIAGVICEANPSRRVLLDVAAALIAYFDTSALIKLIFDEPGSELAAELWDRPGSATSSQLIYPEARAAVAMAHRVDRIDAGALHDAVRAIDDIYAELRIIGIDNTLARAAGGLAERHGLRGYDAVHLASAISIEDPRLVMVTWDKDLATAALSCGTTAVP